MKKINFIFIILVFSQIWAFSQNSKFEEFNFQYQQAFIENKELALKSAFKALEISESLKNDSLIANAYSAVSFNYRSIGNLTNALDFALKADPYIKKSNNQKGNSISYMQIAGIYGELNNWHLALNTIKNRFNQHKLLKTNHTVYLQLFTRIQVNYIEVLEN